ncbi:unnamed protein product [Orchesella dallaii]|uniref:Uncharacterized protein n=1 Tax=Orchesella dallaii TaxID=48710 RepID=A0ABP1Q9T6_9HEXA
MCDDITENSVDVQTVKCVLVGDSQTGKTRLFERFINRPLSSIYIPTVFDVVSKEVEIGVGTKNKVNLNLWDSSGSHVYDSIRPISYPHTDCFIICYSVNDKSSFENVEKRWLPEILKYGDGPRVPYILVSTHFSQDDKSEIGNDKKEDKDHELLVAVEGERLRSEIQANAFYQCAVGPDIDVQYSDMILQKAVDLAYIKKLEEEKPPNPVWKFQSLNVVLMGDKGVGKSSLVQACFKDQLQIASNCNDNTISDENYHNFIMDGTEYFLRITEIHEVQPVNSLLEKFDQIHVLILCYAINDPFSFQSVAVDWHRNLNNSISKPLPILLIGNKTDLKEDSLVVIPSEDGEELMLEKKFAAFMECSAKSSENIAQILKTIVAIFGEDT